MSAGASRRVQDPGASEPSLLAGVRPPREAEGSRGRGAGADDGRTGSRRVGSSRDGLPGDWTPGDGSPGDGSPGDGPPGAGAPAHRPRGHDVVLRAAFVAGYVCVFLLKLPTLWVPEGQRHGLTMTAYVVLFVLGVLGWRTELVDRFRQVVARKRRALATLGLGFLLIIVVETAGGLAAQWLSEVVPGGRAGLVNDSNVMAVVDRYPPWVIVAVLAVAGPIVEELFFRQLLLTGVARFSRPWVGLLVSSVLFGTLHMSSLHASEWIGVIPHACFGLALGVVFLRTRRNLVFPATLHVLNNLSAVLPMI
ncbi:CAAX amino terminal protease self- immunity [Actinomyces howellii]|uniref:CAAX amino terminal protease self- immunity n=2 Tax=Actinomyces howellii TaxID=52771 RepID=A0A3S4RXN1_9ACTO|nr:CAAX amino terminal protease self- immunity [Actinomyces howellii]